MNPNSQARAAAGVEAGPQGAQRAVRLAEQLGLLCARLQKPD